MGVVRTRIYAALEGASRFVALNILVLAVT